MEFSKLFKRKSHRPEASSSTSTSCPSSTTNAAAGSNSNGGRIGNERFGPTKDDCRFVLKVDKKLWPTFSPEEDDEPLDATCPFIYFTETLVSQWAKGVNVGSCFGERLFRANNPDGLGPNMLPPLLFDLVQHRIVKATEIGMANYAVISHVWGHVIGMDGLRYGVDWKIPIRNEHKLAQILEAARVVTGERYIWMDVLCMDQRKRNEHEIAKMKAYFNNATGCLVWLDNAFDEPSWREVLSTVEEVNKFFSLDKFGTASETALETFYKDESFVDLSLTGGEAFKWIKELVKVEKAPWFKRVWTLQEAVLPERLYFCTPERYMTGGANIFLIACLCERMAKTLVAAGAIQGTAIFHELQRSEIYKTLKLRKLYRRRETSYWHLAHAVRTRECKYEQDKVLGVCGMVHGTVPVINYDRSIEGLYQDLYKTYVDDGDFKPCLFLGGRSLLPDKDMSIGFISPTSAARSETHKLVLTQNGLRMDGIGIDHVKKSYYIVGHGPLRDWGKKFPNFMNTGFELHADIARAFELDTDTYKRLCPAAFAAMGALTLAHSDLIKQADKRFQEMFFKNEPKALLMWIKFTFLQQNEDIAAIIIWTSASTPQLAVVSEPLEGHIVAVMPSSYLRKPGPGCLICKVLPNGNFRKVGIGLGNQVKATTIGTFNLSADYDPVKPTSTSPTGSSPVLGGGDGRINDLTRQFGINLDGITEGFRQQYGNDVAASVAINVKRFERLPGRYRLDPTNQPLDNARPGERLKYETAYKYSMIAKSSFRLLNIWSTGAFPLISLKEYPFHAEQKYIAVSYAWGREIETRTMFCDFKSYAISAHVLAALNHLRHIRAEPNREDVQLFWIDSICINQNNPEEKAQQVAKMTEIYSQAEDVVIWLGAEEDDSTLAFENIRTATWFAAASVSAEHLFVDLNGVEVQQEPDSRTWRAIGRLFCRPWFHRMWVIQELLLAKKGGLVCGSRNAKLWAFSDLALAIRMSRPKPALWSTDDPGEDKAKIQDAIETFNFLMDLRKHGPVVDGLPSSKFAELLNIARFRDVTLLVDRIWSLLGVAQPSLTDVRI